MSGAPVLGWTGLAIGLGGLVVYLVVVLRRPAAIRMLNGSGLLLTSLALTQARSMSEASGGPDAFPVQAAIVLLILAVIVQAGAALRNRRAWDGEERRAGLGWDGFERRGGRSAEEERA